MSRAGNPRRGFGAWLRRVAVRISLLSLVVLLLTGWIAMGLWSWLYGGLPELPFPVSINGHDLGLWWQQLDAALRALQPDQRVAVAAALALAILLVAVLVPLALLLVLATALGVVMLLLALLSSPLWLLGLLLWWLLKPAATAPPAVAGATARTRSDSMQS
jgi:hypothetical protein